MKTRTTIIVLLSMCMLFTGCGASKQTDTTPNDNTQTGAKQFETDFEGRITGLIKLSKPVAYGGVEVEVSADFPFEPGQVSFGLRLYGLDLKPSMKAPVGTKWSDSFKSPDQTRNGLIVKPTVFDVIVVASPKNGSESISCVAPLTIVPKPKIEVKYNRMKIGQPQTIELQASEPISSVWMIDPNRNKIIFSTTDKKLFRLETVLHDAKDGFAMVHAEDEKGLSFDKTIYVDDPSQKRMYFIKGGARGPNDSETLHEEPIYSARLDGKDVAVSFYVRIPILADPYLESLLKYSKKKKLGAPDCSLKGISPDKHWLLINAGNGISFEKDYMEDGRKLDSVSASYFLLYELETGKIKTIGESHYTKYYKHAEPGDLIKEFGPYYFPVFWDDNELILLEQTKENKFYAESTSDPNIIYKGFHEVPYAKARGVSVSMKDFTLSPTEKFNPLTPWVTYADQATGVVCYTSPFVQQKSNSTLKKPSLNLVSDLSGKHSYELNDILAPHTPDKFRLTRCVVYSTTLDNNQPSAIIFASFSEDIPGFGEIREIDPDNPPKQKRLVFKLNLYTGEIETLPDFEDMKFTPISIECGTGNSEILVIASKAIAEIMNFEVGKFFIVTVNGNKVTKQVGEPSIASEYTGIFVR
ncbi:MAG: hypothetical protein KBC24_06830 [Caldisericia bacterium]|nr:hypothetical protein [Caldisericia bacterium]